MNHEQVERGENKPERMRQVRQLLRKHLGQSIGWNSREGELYITGPLPWGGGDMKRRWTADDSARAHLWCSIPIGKRFLRGAIRGLALENKFFPADGPPPVAMAKLVQDGARWRWIVKCPYCREQHIRMVIGIADQMNPRRALGFAMHQCKKPVSGARGYLVIEQPQVSNDFQARAIYRQLQGPRVLRSAVPGDCAGADVVHIH